MYLKYLKSQLRHKWFVFLECCKLRIPWLGIVHDLSKFTISEWRGYARYFYGKKTPSVEFDFDVAWLHHQHRNKHHWQRWLLTLDSARSDGKMIPMIMPEKYQREMLADWYSAGRAYGNPNTAEWYLENREQIQLHPVTRQWIESQLGCDYSLKRIGGIH